MIGVNLMPAARRDAMHRKSRVLAWAVTLTAYAGALGAAGIVASSAVDGGASTRSELAHASERLTMRESQVKDAAAACVQLDRKLMAARMVSEHPDWSVVAELIAERKSSSLVLDSISVIPVGGVADRGGKLAAHTVEIAGAGDSQRAVNDFIAQLEQLGLFTSVKQVESRARVMEGRQMVGFHVECALSAAPSPQGASR
jgi:Tfp pilus assembly protein PilN